MARKTRTDSAPAGSAAPPTGVPVINAERDMVALGIIFAALILFVGTGSSVLTEIARNLFLGQTSSDALLGNALILNIALIIFGWRRYVDLSREVGERRKAEASAQLLAETDALTGCLNRRSVDLAIERLAAQAAVAGEDVAVMMLDLDRFKRTNDIHGHQAGDVLLAETARRLREILPVGAVIARLGGDEFSCALTFDPARASALDALAQRLNEEIARPIPLGDGAIEITASIGLARGERPDAADAVRLAHDLLHRADLAMYQAKKAGRNRHVWFEADMEQELRFRSELERNVREGLLNGEFVPFYEKQIDLETGDLVGFEMLARWRSPIHGLVSPELFIPVAEDIGVIAELSESLIRQALTDARDWDPRLTLSVNISPIQLRDPWFAQKLLKLLVEANFPPARLDIEVTESCLHENIGVVRTLITSLRNQGVRVSLDDFGTGYSSLTQLRTLPFDRIKIDRSFVSSLGHSKDSATIVEAITSLGKGMDLPITAEGIESAEVLDELRKFGRFKGQGYLYGRPAAADTVRAELAAQNLLAVPAADGEAPAPEPGPIAARG